MLFFSEAVIEMSFLHDIATSHEYVFSIILARQNQLSFRFLGILQETRLLDESKAI